MCTKHPDIIFSENLYSSLNNTCFDFCSDSYQIIKPVLRFDLLDKTASVELRGRFMKSLETESIQILARHLWINAC